MQTPGLPDGYEHVDGFDQGVLLALVGAGADLTQPRHVLHYLYVGSEEHRRAAAEEARALGWEVDEPDPLPEYPDSWLVLAQRQGVVLTPDEVVSARRAFSDLAGRYEGEYDGWEASL
jgi:regulator of RNase E activity RraB